MVLFDLDGTLVDTAYDLGRALNILMALHGHAELAHEQIRPIASHGTNALLALGFGVVEATQLEALKVQYLEIYAEELKKQPVLMSDIEALLDALDARNVPWGIVTNKPRRFSLPLIQVAMTKKGSLFERAACLTCGDDVPQPKPAPDSLLLACQLTNTKPQACIYVGDAERDIEAGRAAGMKTVVALFGYLSAADQPETWGSDAMIAQAIQLLDVI